MAKKESYSLAYKSLNKDVAEIIENITLQQLIDCVDAKGHSNAGKTKRYYFLIHPIQKDATVVLTTSYLQIESAIKNLPTEKNFFVGEYNTIEDAMSILSRYCYNEVVNFN